MLSDSVLTALSERGRAVFQVRHDGEEIREEKTGVVGGMAKPWGARNGNQ